MEPYGTTGGQIKVWRSGAVPTDQFFEAQRTPTIFKIANIGSAAGDVTLWTPESGKRFRLMGFSVSWGDAYFSGGTLFQQLTIRDATDNVEIFRCGAIIGGAAPQIPIVVSYPANGYLSTKADSALVINKSATLSGGSVLLSYYGCEE